MAYRGAPLVTSENTLSSLRAAKQLGAKLVEFDVRLTKDKQAIILHDPWLVDYYKWLGFSN
ncbi:glycerophosphodiester phosphodiesterase [Candidatus Coxiella mudrowiae]|uniref:glycerophosphodiester phosphodiesterase n=1 Tax=Candidatus Coxiella mudrowiae TaxID=2054173 RepID=UPI001FD4E4D0|nr:glycerophosphodiester phosphodiesterase family protein [Candidatus Coxiella mudrowiae]